MTRIIGVALSFVLALAPAARADDDSELKQKLESPVALDKGIDRNTPLKDVLEFFADRYDLDIMIDVAAFAKKGVDQVDELPVWMPKCVGLRLELVLHMVASQCDAAVEVRKGAIWLVPHAKPVDLADVMKAADPKLQKLMAEKVSFEGGIDAGTPLKDALELITQQLGQQFLIDGRAFERAKIEEIEEKPVRLASTKDEVFGKVLEMLLKPAGATFVLRENVVVVVPLAKK